VPEVRLERVAMCKHVFISRKPTKLEENEPYLCSCEPATGTY
jgi:hypothetical protein